ncbi:YqgE/AlgH family protein [Actinoplanes sp. CA-030573]|uniref:YqgE/AlgH family protein n=1 Tax=Actinoplanes sp. CA-030573 TaxID=3239898 RepID=UPI003D93F81B
MVEGPGLADPHASVAVLIGAADYEHLDALPTVERNLTDLRDLLCDDLYWGLPPERCRVLANPSLPNEMELALVEAAEQAGPGGLFLVYYAGHGVVADSGALHLSVRITQRPMLNSTSFPYEWLRERILTSRARHRVVVLDCCYAGRALERMGAEPVVEIDRASVLVASARNSTAYAPADEEHTAFTGELIRTLKAGLPGGPELLDLATIWRTVREALEAKGRPLPELRDHNPGLHLVRNAARQPGHLLVGQVLSCPDGSLGSPAARLLVLDHRPDQGAVAVRLDERTTRPVRPVLGEWAEVVTEPPVLWTGGPLDPYRAFGVAVVHDGPGALPAFSPLAGRVGLIDLTSDPRPARLSDVRLRVFVGYYGWGPLQLEAELAEGRLVAEGPVSEHTLGYE